MLGFHTEAGQVGYLSGDICEATITYRDGPATGSADEMLMGSFVGKVVHGGTVAHVTVIYETGILEDIKRPIDRRKVGMRGPVRPGLFVDRRGSQVETVGRGDDLAHGAPWSCHADASFS